MQTATSPSATTIPDSVSYELYASLKLTMEQSGTMVITGEQPVVPTANTGVFDVTAIKNLGGTFDTTLTVTVANAAINSAPAELKMQHTYSKSQLNAPTLTVNTEDGTVSWNAVDNAEKYYVRLDDGNPVELDGTVTTYDPNVVAGP